MSGELDASGREVGRGQPHRQQTEAERAANAAIKDECLSEGVVAHLSVAEHPGPTGGADDRRGSDPDAPAQGPNASPQELTQRPASPLLGWRGLRRRRVGIRLGPISSRWFDADFQRGLCSQEAAARRRDRRRKTGGTSKGTASLFARPRMVQRIDEIPSYRVVKNHFVDILAIVNYTGRDDTCALFGRSVLA